MRNKQQEIITLTRDVLGDQYLHLEVASVVIEENVKEQTTSVVCETTIEGTGERNVIKGKGVGVIDAFFEGMVSRFAEEYPSLRTIRFHSFSITAEIETKQEFSGSDSQAQVSVEIANSEGKLFVFTGESRSVTSSAILTTLAGLEYFLNGERAFVAIYHALKDAKQRSRADLVQRYTNTLATLVQNTSYSEVISRLREDIP